jgi:DNA-binding NtrC family response regulator
MPGMDGIETMQAMKDLDPELRVVIATAYVMGDARRAADDAGAFDYLQKPFELQEFHELVARALRHTRPEGGAALGG